MDTIHQNGRKGQLSTEPIFYVYLLLRPNDHSSSGYIPFYVGKGHAERVNDHFACARNHKSCKHLTCRVIRKVWHEGKEVKKEMIVEGILEESAFSLEKFFISIGAIYNWPLVNQTFGGEGCKMLNIGRRRTPEELERQSQRMLEKYAKNPEMREQKRKQSKENWETPEYREKSIQGMKSAFTNPDTTKLWSEKSRKMWSNPEYRAKRQEAFAKPEVRMRLGKGQCGKLPPNTKIYTGFLAPDGITIYRVVYNLTAFSKEHGLSRPKMCLVAQGKRLSHKGWTRYQPDKRTQSPLI